MNTIASSIIFAAALAVLPVSVSAHQESSPQQPMMDSQHMDMMQGQGSGGGMGMGGGMGTDGMGSYGMGMGGSGYCGDVHGRGMMDGRGWGGGASFLTPFRALNLNEDQRTRINRIALDLRKQLWSLKGKNLDIQAQLYDLYAADRPDPKKIGAVYGKIFDVRQQMIEAKIDAMNRARDVLNKEQREKLKQLHEDVPYCCDFDQ